MPWFDHNTGVHYFFLYFYSPLGSRDVDVAWVGTVVVGLTRGTKVNDLLRFAGLLDASSASPIFVARFGQTYVQ